MANAYQYIDLGLDYFICYSGAGGIWAVFLRSEWSWWISFCVCQHIWSHLEQECHCFTVNARQLSCLWVNDTGSPWLVYRELRTLYTTLRSLYLLICWVALHPSKKDSWLDLRALCYVSLKPTCKPRVAVLDNLCLNEILMWRGNTNLAQETSILLLMHPLHTHSTWWLHSY